jgi:transposase-like protein
MLQGEQAPPEAILTLDGNVVNRLFEMLKHDADRELARRFFSHLKEVQVLSYERLRSQLCCPSCNSPHFVRKGWRRRVVKSSRGRLEALVLQARCKICGRTFRPLNGGLGLATGRRFLDEVLETALQLSLQLSYGRSSAIVRKLTGGKISGETLRQKMAAKAVEVKFNPPRAQDTVLVDATKVRAGSNPRGIPVFLAISAKTGAQVAGRPSLVKKLLHLHVGRSDGLKEWLKTVSVRRLVHDGGEDLSGFARSVQRCRWHLVHQMKHYLWQDGVPHNRRAGYQKQVQSILMDDQKGSNRYRRFIKRLLRQGLMTSAGHLQAAEAEAFTCVKEQGFRFATTSPLEREMREINRRVDNGSRWSERGIESLLKVLFHYRFNHQLEPKRVSS